MQTSLEKTIRVGISTRHGMADEVSQNAPRGITYTFPTPCKAKNLFIKSPIKSYLMTFQKPGDFDLLEAVLSPIITPYPWICSLDCFQAAIAFSFLRLPLPRSWRVKYIESLFRKDNFHKLIFWSEAARKTLIEYGGVSSPWLLDKTTVVYPAIRQIDSPKLRNPEGEVNLLFSGDFFRKGGASVVDSFERLRPKFPELRLRICCDESKDFNTPNQLLKQEYLAKIRANPSIKTGRVSRSEMLEKVLPSTDIYLLPTYNEAFGFAILEAMAYGIPVISTNHFAIPEIIEHGKSGLLIDFGNFAPEKLFRGYIVSELPEDFHRHVTDQLTEHLVALVGSSQLRERISNEGLAAVRSKFSFSRRNEIMLNIYKSATGKN